VTADELPPRRRRLSLALAAAAVGLILAVGLVGTVVALKDLGEQAGANSRHDFGDREVAWGNGWTLSQEGLYAARSLIPPRADYDVVMGAESKFSGPLTHRFAPNYLHAFLMPRHWRAGAPWVVCYRCDRRSLGDGVTVLWEDVDAGVSILRRPPASAA
jgi:hypothetical protein